MSCKNLILLLGLALTLLPSCVSEEQEDIPDVSDIEVDLTFRRFEQDLFALDTNSIAAGLAQLEASYPEFSSIYFNNILGSKDPRIAPGGHEAYIRGFLNHPSVRHLYDTCMIVYPDMYGIEDEFRQAIRFFRYYFPDKPAPATVTTFLSEYTIAAFVYGENDLAVGLDFFLGPAYPYAKYNPANPAFSDYLTRTFNRDHLVRKTMEPLVNDLLGDPQGDRLLDLMIHNGKKLYLLDKLLPYEPDSVIMEVTPEQVVWLENNEFEMWAYFLKEDLLYSSNYKDIRKLVTYSPHSPGMPPEAPGRTANWVGWQIVRTFMKRFPQTTMRELIVSKDAQEFLDRSRYKPMR